MNAIPCRLLQATLLVVTIFAVSEASAGGNPSGVVMYAPGDMQWRDWGISAQRAVLTGDPNHHGCAYTDRVRFRAGTRVEPHALREDKIYTVISGTLYVGIGEQWDESKLHKMPPGSFWTIPANVSRFFRSDEEAVFQSTAMMNPGAKDCAEPAAPQAKP